MRFFRATRKLVSILALTTGSFLFSSNGFSQVYDYYDYYDNYGWGYDNALDDDDWFYDWYEYDYQDPYYYDNDYYDYGYNENDDLLGWEEDGLF